jgi:hypothetical protein
MKGNCTPFERTKQIELQQLKNQAYLISEMENSRFCDLEFANWNWYKRDVQWEIFLKKCKKLGLSVIDTKELRKLENFQAKIDTAVRDYPNY